MAAGNSLSYTCIAGLSILPYLTSIVTQISPLFLSCPRPPSHHTYILTSVYLVRDLRYFRFNIDKCSVMHIRHSMQSNYSMSNQQLPTTDQQRDLGIIFSKDLKWQKQTEKSCKMAKRVLGFIAGNFR